MNVLPFLQARKELDSDLFLHRMLLPPHSVILAGFKSLIDLPQTILLLQQQAQSAVAEENPLLALGSGIGSPMNHPTEQTVWAAIAEGYLVVLTESSERCIKIVPAGRQLTRAIESPSTENVLRGAISAFNEDLDTNIGLIKKHLLSDQLRIRPYVFGRDQLRRTVLLYIAGKVHGSLLRSIVHKIESCQASEIHDLQALSNVLGFPKWTLISRFNTTELPQEAAYALRNGKVVLFLDRFPFAVVLPCLLSDMYTSENDRNTPYAFKFSFQLLRILGILTNVLMPGLYVALVSVNPEVLRLELALSIAGSREGVPYPALVETLLMLFILELTLESSIRLPKTIGPTITMIGGIILGQAVVQAKLVSNILIIVLAATTIANFTVIGFQNATAIRLYKYLLLVLSAMYGVLGLFIGIVIVCAYLGQVNTFGIPYLSRWKTGGRNG